VEAVLENVAGALQPAVEFHCPPGVHAAEQAREAVRIGGCDDEIDVVIHQTIGVDQHIFLFGNESEAHQVLALVEAVTEDAHLTDTASDHVMRHIFQNETGYPRHGFLRCSGRWTEILAEKLGSVPIASKKKDGRKPVLLSSFGIEVSIYAG